MQDKKNTFIWLPFVLLASVRNIRRKFGKNVQLTYKAFVAIINIDTYKLSYYVEWTIIRMRKEREN